MAATDPSNAATVTAVDPSFVLGILFALAAAFFAIEAYYYLRLTDAAGRIFLRRTRRRLRRSVTLLTPARFGCALWLVDIAAVVAIRACLGIYVSVLWFIVMPVLMTFGSVWLAAAIISTSVSA